MARAVHVVGVAPDGPVPDRRDGYVDARCTRLTTTIRYDRRRTARLAWTIVAPVHRAVPRLLLVRAARPARGRQMTGPGR